MANLSEIARTCRKTADQLSIAMRKVEWDLDPSFIGEPVNNHTIHRISDYIDTKLHEYATIMGSYAAPRILSGRLNYDDEQVCAQREPRTAGFQRYVNLNNNPPTDDRFVHVDNIIDETQQGSPDDDADECTDEDGATHGPANTMNEAPGGGIAGVRLLDFDDPSQNRVAYKRCETTPDGERVTMSSGFYNTETGETGRLTDHVDRPNVSLNGNPEQPRHQPDVFASGQGVLQQSPNRVRDVYFRAHEGFLTATQASVRPTAPASEQLHIRQDYANDSIYTSEMHKLSDSVTYVTSYDINYATLSINARIIVAPWGYEIPTDRWFDYCSNSPKDLKSAIREAIKANLTIRTPTKIPIPYRSMSEAEKQALETLREMVTEEEYRTYVCRGYIVRKGARGRLYQINRTGHTKVFEKGTLVEELCMNIEHKISAPPTDSVIAKLVMIECNEQDFRSASNVYRMQKAA